MSQQLSRRHFIKMSLAVIAGYEEFAIKPAIAARMVGLLYF